MTDLLSLLEMAGVLILIVALSAFLLWHWRQFAEWQTLAIIQIFAGDFPATITTFREMGADETWVLTGFSPTGQRVSRDHEDRPEG